MGFGNAWGVRLTCTQDIRRVRFSQGPPIWRFEKMKLTDEQIKEGFATLGKNNAEALKKACESITKRTKDFFDKAKKKK